MESKEPTRPTLAASASFDRTLAGPAQPTRPPSLVDTRAETFAGDRRSGAADRQIQHGQLIGRYMVLSPLGSGGMGVVYAAYDPQLDRKVALKLLHPEAVSASGATQSKIDGQERLLREAQAMARLHHPNVVAVHDVGKYDERIFIAMEFVEGGTLKQWLRARPRTRQEVLAVFGQAGRGLQAAHEAGLVHRDFKPDNVLVSDKGRAQVLDFGLAKQTEDGDRPLPERPTTGAAVSLNTALTQVGAILGTPAYMSPEQHLGEATDARTDQFSFCVALYEALYGTPPFHGDSMAALATAVLTGEVAEAPRESYARVPPWLRKILLRGLAVDPAERYPSIAALLDDLARDPSSQRKRWLLAVGAAAAVALGAAGWAAARPDGRAVRGGPRRAAGRVGPGAQAAGPGRVRGRRRSGLHRADVPPRRGRARPLRRDLDVDPDRRLPGRAGRRRRRRARRPAQRLPGPPPQRAALRRRRPGPRRPPGGRARGQRGRRPRRPVGLQRRAAADLQRGPAAHRGRARRGLGPALAPRRRPRGGPLRPVRPRPVAGAGGGGRGARAGLRAAARRGAAGPG
ncbi:serine/threonine-protein kinase [Nannocystis pusilla]|uniref:Serine/threonine-protein kinase n=1 Tax=Nannocystis pusilla TaxID=889268 RepID=A0A9X3J3M9_9BACT|nr:serine/threonine-protein kinase [Nannocystis pusilla]MCY1012268.1 serine/threonine-protein kinase [Nannocystis pusilla]